MKSNFLIGNFMPGYVSAIEFGRDIRPAQPIDRAELAERFARRHSRSQQRRRQYQVGIRLGLLAALLVAIGAFSVPFQLPDDDVAYAAASQEVVQIEEIQQTQQVETPPPPPRPAVLALVPDDADLEDVELDLDASLDLEDPMSAEIPPPPGDSDAEEEDDAEEIFVVVEEMPTIVGGLESLYSSLTYPTVAQRAGMEGRVVVQVVVNQDGTPSDPQVLQSAGPVLDPAAVEAVMEQRFTPGRQRNQPVRTRLALTVNFRLAQS